MLNWLLLLTTNVLPIFAATDGFSFGNVVIITLLGGIPVLLVKIFDIYMSKSNQSASKEQVMYTRQKELDNVKDNLISVFQTQINDLREQIDELIAKNSSLHERNIELTYEVAGCKYEIKMLKQQLGLPDAD
jgi:peptidoglycan hydrolase CwlO-like protein